MKKMTTIYLVLLSVVVGYSAPIRSIVGAHSGIDAFDAKGEMLYWGLCFTAEEPNVVVNMSKTGSPPVVILETSRDGVTWIPFDADGGTTPITLEKAGDYVYFKAGEGGNERISASTSSYRTFTIANGRCSANGNIMSLLNGEDVENTTISGEYCFSFLFNACRFLTSAPQLPALQLSSSCYLRMFTDCSRLTIPPQLPAKSVPYNAYRTMFYRCTSLISAPELPATTLGSFCYVEMFSGCSNLTTGPDVLPATSLQNYCYMEMFKLCTKLTIAPKLPATRLVTACYNGMFYGCSSLTNIEVRFSNWNNPNTWVQSVAPTGTFYCPTALGTNDTIERGASRCPTGWTVVNID